MVIESLYDYKMKLKRIGTINFKIAKLMDLGDEDFIKKEIEVLEYESKKLLFENIEVDVALEQLDEESRYLVRAKYIFEKKWPDIEFEYNKTFRKKPPILKRQMIRKTNKAIRILAQIMEQDIA